MKVSGHSLHDDADYAVLASSLFRFTKGHIGSLQVYAKVNRMVFPVSRSEVAYLKAVIGCLAELGLRPGPSETTAELFREFAQAVCSRGGWGWQVFFTTQSPQEKARELYGSK